MPKGPSARSRPPPTRKSGVAVSTWLTASHLAASDPIALITAREAVRRLGVKPATLYAYVSRGLLRSAAMPRSRERRYYADDVERLKQLRRTGRRVVAPRGPFDSLAPVLDSAICLVENGRIHYRGIDIAVLADRAGLEETARLLWDSETVDPFEPPGPSIPLRKWLNQLAASQSPIERARSVLVALATQDVGAFDLSSESVARTAGRLVPALAAAITGAMPTPAPIHRQLATAWGLDQDGADLIRRCLVLAADHELNASTYVARCVASTAASPYAVVIAALCALSGPRHGGQTSHVESLLAELAGARDIMGALTARLQRDGVPGYGGERIPGFGHPLYPDGDPRAANILDALGRMRTSRRGGAMVRMGQQISDRIGRKPNFDFSLAAVSVALNLPRGAGLGVFLVGRTVGWIAHAIEQYATPTLIRPRARYVGVLPLPPDSDA